MFNELWCNGDRALFPETVEVLEYFYKNGYKMGVISDTSPSLEYTLQQLGIAKYFTSFTASSLVGAGKLSRVTYFTVCVRTYFTVFQNGQVEDHR